jgi:hypothetical protein
MLTADKAGCGHAELRCRVFALCCVGRIYSGASANAEERLAHRSVTSSSVQLLGEPTVMLIPKKFNLDSRVEAVRP